jgi:hypothetical protein
MSLLLDGFELKSLSGWQQYEEQLPPQSPPPGATGRTRALGPPDRWRARSRVFTNTPASAKSTLALRSRRWHLRQ